MPSNEDATPRHSCLSPYPTMLTVESGRRSTEGTAVNRTRWYGGAAAAGVVLMATTVVAGSAEGIAIAAAPPLDPAHVDAVVQLMSDLEAESEDHAARIREAYADAAPRLAIANRAALEQALAGGTLLSLPPDVAARNVHLRLTGRHPIGEADLAHQHLYVGARPEVIGLLLEIASRVSSGPLEVTSLVRHGDYQRRLARSNANARTAVPTHVMGLAVDISILHAPLDHAAQIRDVLREMATAGELYFVAERRQLVFHIVPAPDRRDHFAARSRPVPMFTPGSMTPPSTAQRMSEPPAAGKPDSRALVSEADPASGFPVLLLTFVGIAASEMIVRRRTRRRRIHRPPAVRFGDDA